jgi:hypothetical protein
MTKAINAVNEFVAKKPGSLDSILSSTGNELMRAGETIMWWVDDDLYAMAGDTPHAAMWITRVFYLLCPQGHTMFDGFRGLIYNNRTIGSHEVIHLVGCVPLQEPETGISAPRSHS